MEFEVVDVDRRLAAGPGRAGRGGGGRLADKQRGGKGKTGGDRFIGPVYETGAAEVQRRCEKSTAATAVARLRLETPSRIGIARRASARSSNAALSP